MRVKTRQDLEDHKLSASDLLRQTQNSRLSFFTTVLYGQDPPTSVAWKLSEKETISRNMYIGVWVSFYIFQYSSFFWTNHSMGIESICINAQMNCWRGKQQASDLFFQYCSWWEGEDQEKNRNCSSAFSWSIITHRRLLKSGHVQNCLQDLGGVGDEA